MNVELWGRAVSVMSVVRWLSCHRKSLYLQGRDTYRPPEVDRIWLSVHYNKAPHIPHILSTSGGL